MKKIIKSIKIAFTILVMSSLNFACNSSSQEAVAPTDADVTTARAATEATPTGVVIFEKFRFLEPRRKVASYGNENVKGNFNNELRDVVSYVSVQHNSNSSKKKMYVKLFTKDNQNGESTTYPAIKRGETRDFGVPTSIVPNARSFSIYYAND